MAKAYASKAMDVSPDAAWALIGGFGDLPRWLPYIPHSELTDGGRVRHLRTPDGQAITERLVNFDETARSYSYRILEAPFPVVNYLSTIRVNGGEARGSCRVDWFGEFTPTVISDKEASSLFQGIYEDGLVALARALDGGRG